MPLGAHVVLRVHGEAEESGLTLAGFRTSLVAGLPRRPLQDGRGPGAQWPLVWTLALGCLPHLRVAPAHCCLERSLPSPQIEAPFVPGASSEWLITYVAYPPPSWLCWSLQGGPFSPRPTPLPSCRGRTWSGLFQTTCDYPHACVNGLFQSSAFP